MNPKNAPNSDNVCGVVITYNGSDKIAQTLEKLKQNVNRIIVVDNNSQDNTLMIIHSLKLDNIYVLENKTNIGVAAALNMGAKYAKKLGFPWILTMDQDSILEENVIEEMSKVYAAFSNDVKEKIACLAPIPILNGEIDISKNFDYYYKDYVITSGNLVDLNYLDIIGGYEEKLFIDSIDFDFSLKLRELNLLIIQCTKAIMHHELGELVEMKLFGVVYKIHIHSSLRKYYMSRNHIYILKRFSKSNLKFCIKKTLSYILFIAQVILFESNKKTNLKAIFRGLQDGIKERYGKQTFNNGGDQL